jgi:hypothetical protein
MSRICRIVNRRVAGRGHDGVSSKRAVVTQAVFTAPARRSGGLLLLVAIALACAITPVLSHDWTFTTLGMLVGPDGTYEMDLYCDFNALLLGLDPGHLDDELWMVLVQMDPEERHRRAEGLKERLGDWVAIRFDGVPVHPRIDFPEMRQAVAGSGSDASLPGSIARFRGRAPEGATAFTIQIDPLFGPVMAGFRRGGDRRLENVLLAAGMESEPIPLYGGSGWMGALSVASGCLSLGFRHIFPTGFDHILLVLGLYLLNTRLRSLLAQIAAFTVGHTAAFAISVSGLVSLPVWLVEPLMLLAIVYVALENIISSEPKPWRSAVLFGCGLLHGLASAGAILELGLSPFAYPAALLSFNAGIGLGLVSVAGLALLATGWLRWREWYRQRLTIPASLLLAAIGMSWAIVRVFAA